MVAFRIAWVIVLALLLSSCLLPAIPPEFLSEQIDRTVTFDTVSENPSAVQGRSVLLGGEVLSVQYAANGMMLEKLELPLSESHAPVLDHGRSHGRFLVFHPDDQDRDKAGVGSRLTIVAKVKGLVHDTKQEEGSARPLLIAERIAMWPSWPAP